MTSIDVSRRKNISVMMLIGKFIKKFGIPVTLLIVSVILVGVPILMAVLWWHLLTRIIPGPIRRYFQLTYLSFNGIMSLNSSDIVKAIITSYSLAPVVTLLSFILALPTAYVIGTYNFPGKELTRIIILLPIILPGMVVALFLVAFLDLLVYRRLILVSYLGIH